MYNAIRYIHENIKEKLTLNDISKKFGYSTQYFCTKFHNFTGKSFTEYVRHYRLSLAALDILSGKKSTDVAFDYGFDTLGGFNKAFLAEFGCLPREYKTCAKNARLYYERRSLTMYPVTDRCEALRNMVVNKNEYEEAYCMQHKVYFTTGMYDAYKKKLSNTLLFSSGIVNMIEKFTPVIIPGELITGFNFADEKYGEATRYADNVVLCDDNETRGSAKLNNISDKDLELYFECNTIKFRNMLAMEPLTKEQIEAEKEWAAIGRCMVGNHTVIGYERVLKLGYEGLFDLVCEWEEKNGTNDLYKATKDICKAACSIGEKYAQKAKELKVSGDTRYNPDDLDFIIKVCSNVPRHGAATFREAVQSLWFAHIINTWEDYINANSLGRLDQILYPYYKADIDKGILTKEEAFELICLLWIKLYRHYDVQQSCVGGCDKNGESQVNELSYMMLDATEKLDFIRCLSVRYSKDTDIKFIERALEVVGHVQKGVPFFFNDDMMIPALVSKGISEEDARDYTQIGCVETVIPGKANPHAVTGETNLLKAIEYVFCNGNSMMYPELSPGVKTGEPEELDTFEKFYEAVKRQIYNIINLTCSSVKKYKDTAGHNSPRPYKSLLTEGCLESGKDFNDSGAKYDFYQIMLGGVPNLADSLQAIKTLVYDEKRYTLRKVKEILEADFPDERVRLEFVNKAPKFGNDIDSVDMIAKDIIDISCDYLEEFSDIYGLSFHAQPFTFLWMIEHGRESAASPDGRRKGEVIAYSLSPMQGRDFKGLTALFNSLSKLPTKRTPGTTSAIVEVDPKLFTDKNIPHLVTILMVSSKKGLENVQFNTVDADTLIDAKKNPDKYRNLAVRVSGFSQKFCLIAPDLQDHIIARTKHKCL